VSKWRTVSLWERMSPPVSVISTLRPVPALGKWIHDYAVTDGYPDGHPKAYRLMWAGWSLPISLSPQKTFSAPNLRSRETRYYRRDRLRQRAMVGTRSSRRCLIGSA